MSGNMDRYPVPPEKRRVLEALIRIIDIIIYLGILGGGIFAWIATPPSVTEELAGYDWLVPVWIVFLIAGGALGAIARTTRIWIAESPATVLSIFGIMIYFVILGNSTFGSFLAGLAAMLVLVAGLMMIRRYLELQIFGTDPQNRSFADRMAEAARRRTGDVPPRRES